MLAQNEGKEYDSEGIMAASGEINTALLTKLNALSYYAQSFPKSLANSYGIEIVYPLLKESGISIAGTETIEAQ